MKFTAATVAATAAYFFGPASAAASMAELKELKMATWSAQAEAGVYDVDRYQALAATTPCVNGKAGEYRCNKVDLVSFLRHQDMGSSTRKGNDVCECFSPFKAHYMWEMIMKADLAQGAGRLQRVGSLVPLVRLMELLLLVRTYLPTIPLSLSS